MKSTRVRIGFVLLLLLIWGLLAVGCNGGEQGTEEVEETVKTSTVEDETVMSNLNKSLAVDLSYLELSNGQPLLQEPQIKTPPERPEDPLSLPQLDPLHWYDMEYAGFMGDKVNVPESPKDGAIGKTIITIVNGNHPYMTAYGIGAKKVADAYDIDFIQFSSDWDIELQKTQVDEAIALEPDMIIINPLDVKGATAQLRKINEAGIPVIVSNMAAEGEGLKYALAWTGPDDWDQFRLLARALADEMEMQGGIVYLTHSVGGSVYYSRLMAPITELKEYAPEIKMLDYQSPGFDKGKSKEIMLEMLDKFGDELTAVICADDSAQLLGVIEALRERGRQDVLIAAAGNSKDGMDAVKSGDAYAITYQSAQADGAMAMKVAVDWFNGLEIEPISYLQQGLITIENVDAYMPAEWRYGE